MPLSSDGQLVRTQSTGKFDDALHNDTAADLLPNHVEPFSLTPSTGGTSIDAKSNTQQRLWMCASQLGHSTRFVQPDKKTNTIVKPIYVYNIETGNYPSPIDHA
ncbi:unnamed protein product [Penicillium crustosum]